MVLERTERLVQAEPISSILQLNTLPPKVEATPEIRLEDIPQEQLPEGVTVRPKALPQVITSPPLERRKRVKRTDQGSTQTWGGMRSRNVGNGKISAELRPELCRYLCNDQ